MTTNHQQVAIITGASRGLGLALARRLATNGYSLVIDARGADDLERTRGDLAQTTKVVAIAGDVSDPEHRRRLIEAAEGQLDLLVNNASILGPSPQPQLADYPLEVLE
ncbi:MAG: SDR family NAD(P)-dependent oxidoreductase, partial [bacterium]